ncbi:uncharacterized protein EV422DRAFT_336982 [Fimicolochytrium jonesii]|uniref:uncharacterized protein n=1 Tax=Fimicolochytrium jonesii TaxID=1396493 RepID=UPI0022FEF48A|nr:uncharacterized protein EV422DRAFT_336982 [Fimicolochytrium jonesii]KAI8815954.1 hypothetical protein EV422DRAFT_336982 [Fimicolochytrium jonesii]
MGRMEQDFQDAEADARHEYSSLRDDVKNKNLEEKHALRIQLEGTVEELWRQFQAALNQYNAATEERKKQFEELKLKDAKNAKEIEQQMRKLVKLQVRQIERRRPHDRRLRFLPRLTSPFHSQETISHIKSRLLLNAKENDERTRTLKSDKELIQHHFQHLKRQMNSFREKERRKLTELTILSNKAIKELKGKVEQAEKIIRLAEMNRKLETEEEKIVPFYRESEGLEGEGEGVQSTPHLPPELSSMTSFHKRYNKVNLDRQALEKQRAQLQEENLHLRGILKQYLDGISVNESVLEMPNPLLVVNGRTNAPMRHPQSRLNVTYVEAAHHQQLGIISGPIGVN